MVSNGLSDLLSNENTGQGDFPGNGLARLLDEPAKPKAQDPTAAPAGGAAAGTSVSMPPSASVADFVKNAMPAAQRVAKRLNVPVEAVIGQWGLETGWGKSVIPGTNNLGNIKDFRGGGVSAKDNQNGSVDKYRQYGSVDEFADDFANLLAGGRYKAVPGTKDAQAYFATLKAAGYAEDGEYVAKGTAAAKMVADAIGKGAGAQAGAPDLAKAPKWDDITRKAEFKALSDAEKAEAKKAYFDYWVAPHAGDQADSLREQFMAKSDTPGLGQRLSEGLDGLNERAGAAIKGMFKSEPALLERPNADVPKNEAASMAPVRPEVRAKFNTTWDSATPQQREAMAAQPGWVGMLARERAGIYGQPGEQLTKTGQQFDPRVESRREALIAGGEDARAAATFARLGAARGIQPGLETAKLGTIEASEFDFDTKQAFGGDQANGLNNVLARGLTKGGLGIGKAITGYGEFLSDVYGLDETGKTMREGSKWARGKEEAIGQRGSFMERNLEGAISSIAQQLPLLIAGAGAASQMIPLAGMAMQSFGQEYSDGKARGLDTAQSATRAAAFAAFEVIGERFGLGAQLQAIKGAARGMANDQIIKFMGESLLKEIPGELLTTTGQFAVDKWAPAGMALNPNATLSDYIKQVADTIAQTVMQGGMMTAGTTGVSTAVRHMQDNGPTNGQLEGEANNARDRALGAWETNGLSAGAQPGAQATPRAEPTMTPHQTVQDADQIVRELAEQAGVPLETVLPQSVVAPVTVAPAPPPAETPAQAQAQGQDEITDADVMAFAESRYRALRDKAEGGVSLVPGDEGMVEQQTPGVALSEVEQRELDALDQMGNDPAAVRTLYGFDGQRTEVAATPAPEIASAPAEVDADIPGFGDTQGNGIAPNWDDLDAEATTEESSAVEIDAPAQDAGTATEGAGVSQPPQVQPKPKTEKEARAQKDYGDKWFGSADKAQAFIAKQGIGESHEIAQDGKKFTIKKKGTPNGTQANQAQQAGAQQQEAGDQGSDAQAGAGAQGPGVPATGRPDVQADGLNGIKLTPAQKREIEAGGTGFVGELGESARSSLQAMRNNPKVPVIKTDANGSYFNDELPQYTDIGNGFSVRGYSVRGDVKQEIKLPNGMVITRTLKSDGSITGSAEGNYDQIVMGKGFAEAEKMVADYFAGRQAAAQTQALPTPKAEAQEPVDSLHNPGKPDPKNSAAMDELDGFKPGDTVDVDGRTIGRSTVELVYRRQMAGLGAIPMARVVGANGKKLDVLLSELTRTEQKPEAPTPVAADDFDAMFDDVLAEELAKDEAKKPVKPKTEKEAKAKRAEGIVREMTEEGRAKDGKPLNGGDVFRTLSGRTTTPYPKQQGQRYASDWLIENAKAEAQARGDDFNTTGFGAVTKLKGGNLTEADRDSALMYLFGQQPAVVPSILKPLASAGKNSASALGNAIDGLGALFGGGGKLSSGFTFDEDTYAKAKPLFKAAVANMGDAGKDLREAMRAVIRMVLDKFGAQAAQNMKPYAVRFVEEISTGEKVATPPAVPQNETDTQEDQANEQPTEPQPVPEGSGTESQSDVAPGDSDSESLDDGLAGNGDGSDLAGGVPAGTDQAGARGKKGAGRGDGDAPGAARDRAGKRAESGAAESDDHVIDADDIGKGGLTKKFADNIAAITVLKAMEAEGRVATPAERKTLAKHAGWGALKGPFDAENKAWAKQHAQLKELLTDAEFRAARASTLDAHYTSPVAVGAMYAALARIGFKGGRVLEPSVGIGNFFGLMPTAMRNASNLHGVELDSLTSRMVAALYPKAKIAKATAFEDFDVPAEFFDVVIGNPPFGNTPITDAARSQYSGFTVHNYFLAKAIDKLRPGGVMAVVVTHNFLDAADGRARKWIGQRANLVGAVRLPNTAFKENAGTSVVTDILIFQKKGEGETTDIAPWQDVVGQQNTNPKTGEVVEHKVNQLFVGRPDLVLGKPSAAGTMHSANEYTVEMDGDIKEGLDAWVKTLTADQYQNIDRSSDKAIVAMSVPDGIKVGSFYVDASGKVMRRGEDVMGNKTAIPWDAKSETALARMKGMVAIREALRTQMRLERSVDATEQDIEANRATLNKLYDDFLKKFKHLNSTTNRSIFLDDTEAHLVQALEFDYDRGIGDTAAAKDGIEAREPSAKKADIFLRRVAFPPQDFMTVTTAKDALLASLNYRGSVDAAYMQEVYSKSLDKIVEELGDVVYQDPQNGLVIADEYLSGDVKTKLAEAKEAAKSNPAMGRNVAALEKVIPKDKKPSEIAVSLGASFVPASVYEEFAKHITGTGMKAGYLKATGQWLLAFETGADQALNRGKYGTSDLSAQNLMELTMMGRGAVVKHTVKNLDGSTTTIVLEKETEAAREKQNAIKQEWQKWIWDQPARAESLVSIYNDTMNRLVARKFDGAHMTFPGKNPTINLLEHQKNGVWRGLQSGQILYDHVVGAGKTFQMVALAMEMRRLGIARKPLFVVPNHLTLQWRSEFTRLYPGSNVLAAAPEDFSKDKRERMFAKIVTGDWDAVIIGHSSLKKIGLPVETEKAVLQEQIDEIAEAIEAMKRQRGDRRIVGDMERIRKTLDAKMKEKLAAIGKRSKVLTFDELGIDAMAVDEMHEFKNLTYNSTMDRNPGMGNPAGSGKAFDMFVKVRWLFDTFGEKVPFVTATGTPVSNSLVEMYNIQRYMQYPTLKASGLHVFDAWAKQFGSVESVYEVAPSGSGYRQSTRFAKFTNLPALMGLYNSFADTITLDDLKAQEEAQGKKFPVPRVQGGRPTLIVAKRSPAVAALMGVPKAQLDEQGRVKFGVDLDGEVTFEAAEEGKFKLRVGTNDLGVFATKEDATLKLVELAMSPVVSVEPGSILGRFANLRTLTKETKGKVNALSLTGEANKAGLDYRLIDPGAADFPGSKINLAVGKMMEIYKQWTADKGAQLVFCDMSIPLSARASYANKARRLYVRDESSALSMKRGTMHAAAGHEQLPFFVVQRGTGKDDKRFDVYDAASGVLIAQDLKDRAGAIDAATALLSNEDNRAAWIAKREAAGEISPEAVDEYNNDNDVEVEDAGAFFLRDDIAGMSGSAKFSVYDDIKAKLMAKGVPEREIAFIHDYASPTAKAKLFKAVKDGDVRFLLGSTPKMGAGTNVQDRLVGLHHIDAPWRPSDLEQREGRIIRRDNKLYMRDPDGFEVFIGRYATEQTYDTRRWQILEHKARGIEQLRNYDGTANEIEDIDGEAATSADMKAAASGDPLILEETKHRTDVKRLERLQAAHQDEIVSMNWRANDAQRFADERGPAQVALIKQQIETAAKHQPDAEGFSPIHVEGSNPSKDKDAAHKALQSAYERVRNHMTDRVGIEYRGMSFAFEAYLGDVILRTPTGQAGRWDTRDLFSPSGMVQRLKNYVDRLPALADDVKAEIEKQAKAAEDMRKQAEQPFAQAGDLQNAREAHKRVQRALMAKGPAVPDNQKGLVRDAMDEQIERLRELGIDEQILSEFLGSDKAMKFSATDSAEGYTGQDEKAQVHPQKTERSARNIRQLQRGVVAYLRDNGQTVDDRVQPYIGVDVRAAQEIRAISQVFGIEVQWFTLAEGLTPEQKRQFGGFDGANMGGVQYLNAKKSDRPHLAVLGHELAHQMRKDSPDLYAEFVDSVNRYIKPGEYKKFLNLAVARDAKDPREEFSGEVLSDLFMERNFWISLGERSPGLLAKVADMVTRLVEQLMQAVGYTKRSAPYVSDFNKVMEIAADVMTRYAGQKMKAAGDGEISFSRTDDPESAPNIVRRVQNNMIQFFGNSQKDTGLNTFNAYDKTVGSQYNKALKDKHFGRVYQLLLGMQNHVSMAAMRAAQLAPGIMPAVDDIKGAAKALFSKRKQGSLDKATEAIFLGTLDGATVMDGKVWAKAEFMGRFGDETAWALYQQTRAAIDASLDEVASAEAYNMASKFLAKDMRAQVIAQPGDAEVLILNHLEKQLAMARLAVSMAEKTGDEQQANEMAAARDSIKATIQQVEGIFVTAKNLKLAGYAPLMRFGKYTVEAKEIDPMTGMVERDENGRPITLFFGRYESEKEARKVEAALRNEYEGDDAVAITAGTYNSDRHELYTGVTPETLELFAEATGMGDMADEFIRLAKSDRSAMKRQLERKGTPGFSQDLPRVLSSFITSNARHAAQRLYMSAINQAVKRIPKEKGDVQQEAQKLRNFVLNPDDAGAVSSSLMFAWFLGGSVAAAAVNMTQPLMVTLPFLTQFTTVANASALLTKSMPVAFGKAEIKDKELRDGLERASLEGVVDAQEIFHLYSMGSNQLVKGNRGQAALTLWGAMFSGVEKINRRMTFIAAWNLAKERGEKNPYAFAVRAVNQTQGIYNKVNRPNIARTWGGRMVMTYKGYSLMVGELMVRMWKSGPQGKKAVMIMLAMLFLAAGEEGLPMSKALDDLIDTIGQLLGFDTNMRRWKRRTAHELMGKEWGDAFLYGGSAWLPLDFGGRLGLGQMLPGTEILKPSSGIFNMRAIGELVGPTAGAGGQIGDAAEASFEGNYGKAVQNASPKAVRDLLAGLEMATRGQATDARGRKVEDVGLKEAGVKAIGFQPTKVAMAHRRTMPIQQDIALQGKREAAIVAKWARAAMDGDQKGVEAAIAERDAWNERNPDTPIVISKQQIVGRVKTMRAEKDTRTFKTAPKEMRGRVGLDLLDE